jgi:hypothetical protein
LKEERKKEGVPKKPRSDTKKNPLTAEGVNKWPEGHSFISPSYLLNFYLFTFSPSYLLTFYLLPEGHPFTIHQSPLTNHHSPFTKFHLSKTTHF